MLFLLKNLIKKSPSFQKEEDRIYKKNP